MATLYIIQFTVVLVLLDLPLKTKSMFCFQRFLVHKNQCYSNSPFYYETYNSNIWFHQHFCSIQTSLLNHFGRLSRILLMLFAFKKPSPRLRGSLLNPTEDELDNWLLFGVTPKPLRLIVLHSHFLVGPHF